MELVKTLEVSNTLGECIIWDSKQQCLYWTDIEQARFYRYRFSNQKVQHWNLSERLGSFGLTDLDGWFIGAFASGIALFKPGCAKYHWLYRLPAPNGIRFNDGRVDRQNRFWCGTMVEDAKTPSQTSTRGQLFCVDQNQVSTHLDHLSIPNGLAFSPDGETLYFNDSPTKTIQQFKLDKKGSITFDKNVAETPPGIVPDGSTVDADGRLWNAQWGGSQVTCYAASGKIYRQVSLPCPFVTSVCFAGTELNFLAVTTARVGMSDEERAKYPQAGHVFIFESPFQGIQEEQFAIEPELKIELTQPVRSYQSL